MQVDRHLEKLIHLLKPFVCSIEDSWKKLWSSLSLTTEEIQEIIKKFTFVAKIARETGFTGIQIHSAHGYLLSEFLSPDINLREDEWGGTVENRSRIHVEIIKNIRREVGEDFPISVKMNSADFQKGGFSPDDSIQVAKIIEAAGVDNIEISGGTYEQPRLLGLDNVSINPDRSEVRRARLQEKHIFWNMQKN